MLRKRFTGPSQICWMCGQYFLFTRRILHKDAFTNQICLLLIVFSYKQLHFHCNWDTLNFWNVILTAPINKLYIFIETWIFANNVAYYSICLLCINVLTFWNCIYCLYNLYYTFSDHFYIHVVNALWWIFWKMK
jgi:hypothetical protein